MGNTPWRARVFSIAIAFTIGAAIAASLVLAIDREHRFGLGVWISDFFKSPGFAGICALGAAALAFWGIWRQVGVATNALDHERERAADESTRQRQVDSDGAWWRSFEWAASRALPARPEERALPYASIVSAFTALLKRAQDDVQRGAIRAIMDEASESRHEEPPPSPRERDDQNAADALRRFLTVADGTPADSQSARAALYELEVLEALGRIGERRGWQVMPNYGAEYGSGDATVTSGPRRVMIEVKSNLTRARSVQTLRQTLQRVRGSGSTQPLVLVSPSDAGTPQELFSRAARFARWRSEADDSALESTLDELLRTESDLDDSWAPL